MNNNKRYLCFFLLYQLSCAFVNGSLSCRDENGKAISWYLLYKLPKDDTSGIKGSGAGTRYMYITSDTVSKGWITSERLITASDSIPATTLQPLYDKKSDLLWILYNDQPPDQDFRKYGGHTKGVVAAEETGGFWLVHSVPHFPAAENTSHYAYPYTGLKFGQSFLCLTLSSKDIDNVGLQLQYNEIYVYWKNIPSGSVTLYPKLEAASKGTKIKKAPFYNLMKLTTKKGGSFYSFAKSTKFKKDLYEDWLAPQLKSDLFVESWLNGRGALKSNCSSKYTVKNIDSVKLCQTSVCAAFNSTKDHSKWAVSTSKNNPWLCVGDINRAESQTRRGGGTVCFIDNEHVWEAYHKSVASIEPCPRRLSLLEHPTVTSL